MYLFIYLTRLSGNKFSDHWPGSKIRLGIGLCQSLRDKERKKNALKEK